MVTLVGKLQHIQLPQIFQSIEVHEKTGLLTIIRGEQEAKLYFRRGRLMYISLLQGHRHVPVVNKLLQDGVSRGPFYTWARKEAADIVQRLLTWSSGEVYFGEGVQPPIDRFLLALRITSLIPSRSGYARTSMLSSRGSQSVVKEPTISTTPFVVEEQFRPAIHPPQRFKPAAGLPRAARAILPLPNYPLTRRLPTAGRRYNSIVRWEVLLIMAILLIAALAHGINMFNFPYYFDDEGTYMAQAWAVIHMGKLAPYTYIYDHAPLGWLQIAFWTIISGGFHTFGSVINSGRVLMLLMQIGSTFMLYRIARNTSHSVPVAVIASLLFALSPYGLYYHRRVLLDNIATFWMLLSILLLVSQQLSLKKIWLSAIALGISILSKEVTIFLVPALAYLAFFRADKSHRWFATVGWIAIVSNILFLYLLMAALNGELFPTGTLLGGTAPHVSLIGTLQYQASRGKDGGMLDPNSAFWKMTGSWMQDDPMLVIVGNLCAIFSVVIIKRYRLVGLMGISTLSIWIFLGRGGEIIGFYLVPLIPLLALNVGLVFGLVVKKLNNYMLSLGGPRIFSRIFSRAMQIVVVMLCFVGMLSGFTSPNPGFQADNTLLWDGSSTTAQQQAEEWVQEHISPTSRILIDDFMWADLHDPGNASSNFTFAYYYWKVYSDPTISIGVFHNDWRNIDYIVTTIDMLYDAQSNHMAIVEGALNHSTLLVRFDTGNWPIEIRKVNK
jgi:4-amino-4-deoxy-L-arabinose transferase-like glycosyltransferase